MKKWRTQHKNLFVALQAKTTPLVNKLKYKNTQKPSKSKLLTIYLKNQIKKKYSKTKIWGGGMGRNKI